MTYKLAVFEKGQGNSVLLLHGMVSSHHYWHRVEEKLAKKRRTITPDLLGFGVSDWPKHASYHVDEHVQAIVESLPAQTPMIVVGHSMGARIAIRLATSHPELVKALILTSLPAMPKGQEYKHLAKEFPGLKLILRGPVAYLACRWHDKHAPLAKKLVVRFSRNSYKVLPARIIEDTLDHNWESYNRSMKQVLLGYDPLPELERLKVPTTIIYGEQDKICTLLPKWREELKNTNVSFQPISNARHNVPVLYPELVAEAILSV